MRAARCVLLLGGGAAWEQEALARLEAAPGLVVLKRCIDLPDLLASAATGQAQVALVAAGSGFDAAAVEHLHRHQVAVVAVVADQSAGQVLGRWGVRHLLPVTALDGVAAAVSAAVPSLPSPAPEVAGPTRAVGAGRVIAVWGAGGAPGRTSLTLGLAAAAARAGGDPLVLDLDPWGGAVAQQLGIVEEVSGLLSANRAHVSGELAARFVSLQRRAAGLRVLTGLPRADRWAELRLGLVDELIDCGRRQGPVLIDTGFALEDDPGAEFAGRPGRNALTLDALRLADEIVVVGAADPVGLARLARGIGELREVLPGAVPRVVVNRMRRSLGWSEAEVATMLRPFGPFAGPHFLPDDRDHADRALVQGRTLIEVGEGPLSRSLTELAAVVLPAAAAPLRQRRAGRARRR